MIFEEILQIIKKEIDIYSTPWAVYDILEELQVSYKIVLEGEILSKNRWSNTTQEVLQIGNRYLEIVWDAPATESQEGQDTNMKINEVFPHKKTIIVYLTKEEEKKEE